MSVHSKPRLRFDEFCLDPQRRLLTRNGKDLDVSPHLVDILEYLASRAGELVTKDDLLNRFWADVHVTENALTRAVANIRKALGDDADNPRYIQTAARRGYRFVAAISRESDSGHERFADFVRGQAALETLDARRLGEAVSAFEHAVAVMPQYAPARTGLASAKFLQFEGTRSTNAPRREWLDDSVCHGTKPEGRASCAARTLRSMLHGYRNATVTTSLAAARLGILPLSVQTSESAHAYERRTQLFGGDR